MERKYLPTFSELLDRLSIVQMKAIFISENKETYENEIQFIMHDIDEILNEKRNGSPNDDLACYWIDGINAKIIRSIMMIMLANHFIWINETKARQGGTEQDKLLKLTHSINGVRNTAKNIISRELGERVDLKIDCLATELVKEFGNWNINW